MLLFNFIERSYNVLNNNIKAANLITDDNFYKNYITLT